MNSDDAARIALRNLNDSMNFIIVYKFTILSDSAFFKYYNLKLEFMLFIISSIN